MVLFDVVKVELTTTQAIMLSLTPILGCDCMFIARYEAGLQWRYLG